MNDRRTRVLRGGVLTALLQRAVGAVIPLASIPIALDHLGASTYGAWAAAVSFSAVLIVADLGVGAGLMTRLSALEIAESQSQARSYVSSAYALVTALAVLLLAGLVAAALIFDLAAAVGAPRRASVEQVLVITLAGFLINIPVALVFRIQYSIDMQAIANLWQIASSLSMFAAMVVAARYTSGPLWFVGAAAFVPVAIGVANSIWLFTTHPRGRALSPHLGRVDRGVSGQFLALGSKFVLISALLASSVAFDPWIVANAASLESVASFSIPSRIFAVIGLLGAAMTLPLWPLHATSVREGDVVWIRKVTRLMTVITAGSVTIVCCVVALGAEGIVEVWLGGQVVVDPVLWWGLALTAMAQSVAGPMFMVQNGAEVLFPQTLAYAAVLFLLPLKWAVASEAGYQFIPVVNLLGYLLIIGPACVFGYQRSVKLARENAQEGLG